VLVFYAGHGLRVDGENFLVPVDAQIDRELLGTEDSMFMTSASRMLPENARLHQAHRTNDEQETQI
jgi:uncharacterized caspase-like protein